jgi:hypothetical protein
MTGVALVAALAGAGSLAAQAGPAEAQPEWELSAAGYWFILAEDDVLLPILYADLGVLHLEARYNYEDLETGSLFAGRTFALGREEWLSLTPMAGVAIGRMDGVVPGLELEAIVGPLEVSSELEYVLDLAGSDGNFFYIWSEASVRPAEPVRFGLAGQRLRTSESGLELDRGVVAGISWQGVSLDVYAFNPFSGDEFAVVGLSAEF